MTDINTIVANVKKKRNSRSVTRKFICDQCNKSVIKILPPLHNPETIKCSCGKEMLVK